MRNTLIDILNPIFGGFKTQCPIHRVQDGKRVDRNTEKDLQGLSEHILRDIGFTTCTS